MLRTRFFFAGFLVLLLTGFSSGTLAAPRRSGLRVPQSQAAQQQSHTQQTQERQQSSKNVEAYTLPPDLYAKAVKYSRAQYILYFVDFIWGVIVLLLILHWRLAPKYRDWVETATKRRFLQAVIFTPILLLTIAIFELPTGIYGHWLSRSYGLSVQGWSSWAGDWAKSEIISFVMGIILVWILYAVIRRSPRRWWFYFWLAALPILLFVTFLSPLVIDPMFNKFEPLQQTDPQLVTALEEVVQRAGMHIPPDRMFLMKASEKTKAVDAYVTGFGASKRVVVWDTTIQKMTVPETMFVFGHEMGHYVLGHIYKGMIFGAALAFVLLYLGFRGMLWTLSRRSSAWGIRGTDDWASLPVLLLWFAILGFLASPITNTYSRHDEHQADQYGLEVTHGLIPNSSQVAARAFQILGEVDLADPHPNPFIKVWLFSHPPLAERVKFALTYDPWAHGKQPEFVK
ncbi:MAG TPA: M48 family metallopeptidase [Candidatus Acidoferrales bacterium]|nr:M48 family metallopeptidase [Candidatus Acidoferrales bacterium]